MTPTPDDRRLSELFESCDPEPAQQARMRRELHQGLEAAQRSLLLEWVELFRVRPVVHGAYAAIAMVALLIGTPLGSLLAAALRGAH